MRVKHLKLAKSKTKRKITMAADYGAIRKENQKRYGTDIGRVGRMLLAEQYGDRTHFIYELLQNAEDALRRRPDWEGPRSVNFDLRTDALHVSHFGAPFDEADVRAICGIAANRKGLNDIGRFGIGFKSVFAYTDRPEVHSGDEDFAIENYVWPCQVPSVNRSWDETVFILPYDESVEKPIGEISRGLGSLGNSALLFLREIERVRWRTPDGETGSYRRASAQVAPGVRQVEVVAEQSGRADDPTEATWLVFSRVVTKDGSEAGHVEIAFRIGDDGNDELSVRPIDQSPLVVFFPTVRETHL